MRKLLTCAILILGVTSCDKDEEDAPAGGLLEKIIQVENGFTRVSRFAFDSSKRLSTYAFITPSVTGGTDSTYSHITRDASGRITQVMKVQTGYPYYSTFAYNGTSSQLKYKIKHFTWAPRDSVAYVYSGNSITEYWFYKYGSSWTPTNRVEYIFQNGNLVTIKDYDHNTGTVEGTSAYTYDNKKPAAALTVEEVFATELFQLGFANNVTGFSRVDQSGNQTKSLTYTYATSGQPVTANGSLTPGGIISLKYFYQ